MKQNSEETESGLDFLSLITDLRPRLDSLCLFQIPFHILSQ